MPFPFTPIYVKLKLMHAINTCRTFPNTSWVKKVLNYDPANEMSFTLSSIKFFNSSKSTGGIVSQDDKRRGMILVHKWRIDM